MRAKFFLSAFGLIRGEKSMINQTEGVQSNTKGGRGGKRLGAGRKRIARDEEPQPKKGRGGARPGAGRPLGSRNHPSADQLSLSLFR